MNPGTRAAFTQALSGPASTSKEPSYMFKVFAWMLIIVLAMALLKVIFSAWHDYQHRSIDHDPLDLITLPLRVILILFFMTLIFYHSHS